MLTTHGRSYYVIVYGHSDVINIFIYVNLNLLVTIQTNWDLALWLSQAQ